MVFQEVGLSVGYGLIEFLAHIVHIAANGQLDVVFLPVDGGMDIDALLLVQEAILLDRVFYSLSSELLFKPAASVVVCRRGGASAAFDRLNKYFTMSNMPLVSSQYWNMAYGQTPGQAAQDEEGMQTMRTLARNMAWMIRKLNVSEGGHPELESPLRTNFIR